MERLSSSLPFLFLFLALGVPTVVRAQDPQVIAYISMDQEHSEAIIKRFTELTGIEVKGVYDTEATKTVGLVGRLIDERSNPQADVYWNNESGQTLRLKKLGLLEPYVSPSAAGIPDGFKDKDGMWTGFAARARVLIYNTDLIQPDQLPKRLEDLALKENASRLAMAKPLTGTTLTHAAALYATWGPEKTRKFFADLGANGVRWESGNGPVKTTVADGVRPFGLTDTDDANVGRLEGKPVATIFLDQEEGGLGTLVIPNTVMLVKGARNAANGKKLIDFLLSAEVEGMLARGASAQIPLRASVPTPDNVANLTGLRTMSVDVERIGEQIQERNQELISAFSVPTGSTRWSLLFAVALLGLGFVFALLALRRGRS